MHRVRTLSFAACLAAALLLGAVGSASAAPAQFRDGGGFAVRPRFTAGAAGSRHLAALQPGWTYTSLPMGNKLTGKITGSGGRIVAIPMYAGQQLHLELRGSNPQDWEMDLWNDLLDDQTPLGWDWGAYPLTIDATAQRVMADRGDGLRQYDWSWYDLYIFPPDGGGTFTLTWSITDPPVDAKVHRIAGPDRFATSGAIARWAFQSTDTAVVATGRNFADALSASSLCGSYGAPLLLTDTGALPASVADAIADLGVKTVIIVGGTGSVSGNVQTAIEALPGVDTSRVAGSDRFATAALIARKVHDHEIAMGRSAPTEAFLVSGAAFPDALAVSPYAFSARVPILLTKPSLLSPSAASTINQLGIAAVHVVGGEGSVSPGVYAAVPGAKDRNIAGVGREDTSRLAAEYAVGRGWATWSQVGVATGSNYPDALGGGVALGAKRGVLLLSKSLFMTSPTFEPLHDHRAAVGDCAVFGGWPTLSGFVMGNADEMLASTDFFDDFRANALLDTDHVTHIAANGPTVSTGAGARTLDTAVGVTSGAADIWKDPVPPARADVLEVMVKPSGSYSDQCGFTLCSSPVAPSLCAVTSAFPATVMYGECQYVGGSRKLVASYRDTGGTWRYLTVSSTWGTSPGKCADWLPDTAYVFRFEFTDTRWRCGWYAADGTTVIRESPWVNRTDTMPASSLYAYTGDPYTDVWAARSEYLYYRRY